MNQIPQRRRYRPAPTTSVQKVLASSSHPPSRNRTKTKQLDEALDKIVTLEDLLQHLRIENWHYLIMGDGSCTGNWQHEAGFAAVVVPQSNPADFFVRHGAFSRGTNIVAEMFAYVLPLMEISAVGRLAIRQIHIVTDCEYLPKAVANPQWQMKANSELWTMLRAFKRKGLMLHWHWLPRDKIDMNKFSHDLANASRVAMKTLAEPLLAKHAFTTIDVQSRIAGAEEIAEET